jgi:hypothetical protein
MVEQIVGVMIFAWFYTIAGVITLSCALSVVDENMPVWVRCSVAAAWPAFLILALLALPVASLVSLLSREKGSSGDYRTPNH